MSLKKKTGRKHTDQFIAECKLAVRSNREILGKLQKEKDLLDEKMDTVMGKIRPYLEILKSEGIEGLPDISTEKLSNADRAFQLLAESKIPMHVRHLWFALKEQGVKTISPNPLNMLAATLANDDRFVKTIPRTFALAHDRAPVGRPIEEDDEPDDPAQVEEVIEGDGEW